jgi:hypothetical protein
MRLPTIPPSDLNAEQQPLYEDMRLGIAASFQGFVNVRGDGALLGPWNPWDTRTKVRKTRLGPDQSCGIATIASRCGERSCDSRHWLALSVGL